MMEFLKPDDLLPGRVDGYMGLESLAFRNESRLWNLLDTPDMDGGESRRRLESVRPLLPSQTKILEYYVEAAAAESCEGLVPKAVETAALLGTILLTPDVYVPTLEFVGLTEDEHTVSAYVDQISREYMRERYTLCRLLTETLIDDDEADNYVRRTVFTAAGFVLWQCEMQNYERFISSNIAVALPELTAWDGTFPESEPPRDITS